MKTPIVTIVGRPNVGKSTLFNKIAGRRIAITADEAGTTRDRLFHKVENEVLDFFLVDTGGLVFGKGETSIEDDMQTQARVAIEEGDLILFVVENQSGLHSQDYSAAELLRKKLNKPLLLVVNKCDEPLGEVQLAEFYSLGLGNPHPVSAMHKVGMNQLIEDILIQLKKRHFLSKEDPTYQEILKQESKNTNVALVGKPNVGKSSLINAILNKEKLIVSDIPGTTRDSTDSLVQYKERTYNFIDTAGLRRPGKSLTGVEHFSALRSMASIEHCDVALLVIDTSESPSHQDQAIASYITEAGKGLVILANKWDLKNEEDPEEVERRSRYISKLRRKFPFLSWAPVVFTSAVTKKNMHHIFEQVDLIMLERRKRITTAKLNTFLERLIMEHPPTGKGKARPKIYYVTQAEIEPPRFLVFVNKASSFHFSYSRYIENRLREKFGFLGTPIKVEYREKPQDRSR